MSQLLEMLKIRDDVERLKTIQYAPRLPSDMRGRLTLTSGAPVTYGSVSGSTVYFTPYVGGFDEFNIVLNPTLNGTTTNGLPTITGISSTLQLAAGMTITGAGIPGGTTVLSVDSTTQITLSANATASATVALTFGVPANTCIDFWEEEYVLRMTLWGVSGYGTSARGYALTSDRGIWYMPGGITQRYLGTGRTLAASVIQDGYTYRFLWNLYNQVERSMAVYPGYIDNNAPTTFASTVGNYKEIVTNAGTIYWVNGLDENVSINASCHMQASAAGNIQVSVMYDALTNPAGVVGYAVNPAGGTGAIGLQNAPSFEYVHAAGAHRSILAEYTVTNAQTIFADYGRQGGTSMDNPVTWLQGVLEN